MKTIKIAWNLEAPPQEYSQKRFEELFELTYLPHLGFANWNVEQWIREKCARGHQKGKIKQLALWLGKLHGHQIEAAEVPDVAIKWVKPEIGYGLFTNVPLKKWAYIGEYTGILRRRPLLLPNLNDYCFMYPRAWHSLKAFTIDSKAHGNYTRFINHRDCPNCESVGVFYSGIYHIIFRTTQDIPAGSELTYDYGHIYWANRKKIAEEPIESLIDADELARIAQLP
jgi:uncharacterized protein